MRGNGSKENKPSQNGSYRKIDVHKKTYDRSKMRGNGSKENRHPQKSRHLQKIDVHRKTDDRPDTIEGRPIPARNDG
ncbi:hypothetical protein CEXT_800071 [Caerostris extrusa]|uniref:Uncharacterized protein n=1 Tax=Caerostris extrusa TaxID=172846 RepID=A0AAV4ULQ5_CAEEX|nr:hypothetical protein CEXT_800071 [Caerostris extrusa]